jgi:methylated-DNA-[protein]-cysteine S-methyltransferase
MTEYDVMETPAGPCAVAMRDGRIVGVRLGRRVDVAARRKRLPRARRWIAAWFAGGAPEVPLEIEASPFHRRVYKVVRSIPPGETRTYGEVARAAGRPGAARSVGNAMARNRVCLFIPCHRVVGSSGPGGFSAAGGLSTKRRLLALEAARAR